jgi:glutathione S-transferase
MRLYQSSLSSNARRVRLTAHHLGLQLEEVSVNLLDQGDRRRLAEINPNGKLPVLDDSGFVLWESCAIMQYLADQAPHQAVYPQDAQARADVNRWMFWACQHLSPAVGIMTWENLWKAMCGMGGPDPAELLRGEQEVRQFAAVLEQHLAGREWVAGKALTLADLAIAPSFMYIERARLPLAEFPNLMAWFARIQALPAWQATDAAW